MNVPIGYVVTLLCCLGGFAIAGGHISVLVQPVEFLIIAGASLGTLISSNNSTTLKSVISALPRAFTAPETNKRLSLDLLCLLFEILNKSRRDGIMSIEGDIEEPANSAIFSKYPSIVSNHHLVDFLTDYLRMMLGGSLNVVQIETLMEKELEVHHHEELRAATVIQRMADGLPAFGIVAAVMGVVHTMGSIVAASGARKADRRRAGRHLSRHPDLVCFCRSAGEPAGAAAGGGEQVLRGYQVCPARLHERISAAGRG